MKSAASQATHDGFSYPSTHASDLHSDSFTITGLDQPRCRAVKGVGLGLRVRMRVDAAVLRGAFVREGLVEPDVVGTHAVVPPGRE